MNIKPLALGAAVAALLPPASFAAIDDQGMAYVSAAEGLSGRIQMRYEKVEGFLNNIVNNDEGSLKLETLRLYLDGNLDIGGGMKSTYHAEIRNDGSAGIKLHAYDIGLTGAFGQLSFGRLNGVADTMVPGGSLDAVAGSSAGSPTSYPDDNSVRYVSPTLGGLKFGLSAKVNGTNTGTGVTAGRYDGAFDNLNAAVSYSHPIGIEAGLGYEKVKDRGRTTITAPLEYADSKGWRLGARYAQPSWTVAYEFRRYEAYNNLNLIPVTTITRDGGRGGLAVEARMSFETEDARFIVHRLAGQLRLDRFTASLNWSKETADPEFFKVSASQATKVKPYRVVLGADVAYALGAKSRVAFGMINSKRYRPDLITDSNNNRLFGLELEEVDTLILDYQVNF